MKILITGGTGTLGHALVRRLKQDHDLSIYSRDPLKQIHMQKEHPEPRYILGDVVDFDRLYYAMVGHDVVIHAAAQKHIPQGETDVSDCIATNIDGSRNVALASLKAGIKKVVGISTDKAASPENVYGATKFIMERIFREANQWGGTDFHLCRYGNVLGSNGSVVTVWHRQLSDGILPTVTDPTMTRFWLTEDQAVDLILFSLNNTQPGEIVVPNAPALSMHTFAEYAGIDEYDVIGRRPGEKKHECLITANESMYTISKDNYFIITEEIHSDDRTPFTSDAPYHELSWDIVQGLI